ncbi:hypothetical protein BW898_26360 [Bacillus cereus]|nr:hypothetical protein BW898_26360 [Bacillus cereus]
MIIAFNQSFQIVWSISKKHLIIMLILKLLSSTAPVVTIYLFQSLINEATKFISGEGNLKVIIYLLILQVSILLFISGIQYVNQINEKRMQDCISIHMKSKVFKKVNKISYLKLETPEFFDKIHLIKQSDNKTVAIVKSGCSLIGDLVTLLGVLGYLFFIHWALVLFFVIVIIPLFIIQVNLGKQRYQLTTELMGNSRKEQYISELLTSRDSVKELKLFNLTNYMINKWESIYRYMSEKYIRLLKKQLLMQLGITCLLVITHALTSVFVIFLIKAKGLMIGALVGVIQSIQNIQNSISNITINVSNLYENSLYVKEYNHFMFIENEEYNQGYDDSFKIRDIEIKSLSFSYPNKNHTVLSNIDLSISPGKKIAIIGENGSGKTTLMKCLTGLYTTKESIFVNGMPLNKENLNSYQSRVSVLFQDYLKYAFTIKENIGLGNLTDIENFDKIKKTSHLTRANEFIEVLPQNYETVLGRLFEDGHELSGGQWQKVSITRSMFRNSDLIILDEPTAALDPKSESNIIDQLFHIAEEKSIILITHRLGVARLADEIIVMKNGEIIERGSHNDLIRKQGEYYQLYEVQSKWFNDLPSTAHV